MIAHYLTVALRSLRRRSLHTLINVLGLGLGLGAALVIGLFVRAERSYDAFHSHADRTYRVTYEENRPDSRRHFATGSAPMAPALVAELPEIEQAVRLRVPDRHVIERGDTRFYETAFLFADSTFFDVFDFPLAAGDPATALDAPESIVLTPEAARKYFGDVSPLGQSLLFDGERTLTVTGVLASAPERTHLQFDFLVSFSTFRVPRGYPVTLESWGWVSFPTYVRLAPGTDPQAVEDKLVAFTNRHFEPERAARVRLRLEPLRAIHLSPLTSPPFTYTNPVYLSGMLGIALLVVLLAGFNFANLSTVQALRRVGEAGVRKALGAYRSDVWVQFLGEALLTTALALGGGLVAAFAGSIALERWLGWSLAPLPGEVLWIGLGVLAGTLMLGLLAGVYPAWLLARLHPALAMKQQAVGVGAGARLRKLLVVVQFGIAAGLIVASLTIVRQLEYVGTRDLGYDREHVVALTLRGEDVLGAYPALKRRIEERPEVVGVTLMGHLFDGDQGNVPIYADGVEPGDAPAMSIYGVHYGFTDLLGVNLVAGRAHDPAFPTDSTRGILLNETAAALFAASLPDWDDPLGKHLRVSEIMEGEVIGVVEDFHFASLHDEVGPLVLFIPPTTMEFVLVRVRPGPLTPLLATLENAWREIVPDAPFAYTFLDEHVDTLYASDRRFLRLVTLFSGLGIIIAALGLYGLVAFVCSVRAKEVAVRKVNGASIRQLVTLLTRPFALQILLGNLIAGPLTFWAMRTWLSDYAYHIGVGPGTFLAAATLTLIVGLGAMAVRTFRAARANPIPALRSE